jgi:DGQHR domain-containing protein
MDAKSRLGETLEIANVTVGKNLNIAVIRGFARLDELALISRADVFDQKANPLGTQRNPSKPHAKQVLEYALGSLEQPADTSPHAFPEIILNARDVSAIRLYVGNDKEEELFNSSDESDFETRHGKIEIDVSLATRDDGQPVFSRVDGNHRLLLVTDYIEKDPEIEFPVVPFSMFVGLTPDQERSIFRDINGEQKSMEVAHLDQIRLRLKSEVNLLSSESGEALWLANQLSQIGAPFHGMVFMGGDRKGFKDLGETIPPIKISSLKSAVMATIKKSDLVAAFLKPGDSETELLQNAGTKLKLLTLYWNAVKNNFANAWQDKTNFVLMQSIGLTAFSNMGAVIIDELLDKKTLGEDKFNAILAHLASKVDLSKAKWAGYAGAAGAREVFNELQRARVEGFDVAEVLAQLHDQPVSPLDE